jgi:hypothetical protein
MSVVMEKLSHQTTRVCNELQCHVCGKSWHVRDPDPPKCLSRWERNVKKIQELKRNLGY